MRASMPWLLVSFAAWSCTQPDRDGRGGTIAVGQTVNASLTSDDMTTTAMHATGYSADSWSLPLTAGATVTIAMCRVSTNLRPHLELDRSGMFVTDDVSGGTTTPDGAVIVFTPTVTGSYVLYAADCCAEPVPNDGENRDYTIQVIDGGAGFGCPHVGS